MAGLVKGPAIFLAQFAGDAAPFNAFPSICQWAASLGYKGIQVPSWDGRLIDLAKAASSKAYCDELVGIAASHGLDDHGIVDASARPAGGGQPGL